MKFRWIVDGLGVIALVCLGVGIYLQRSGWLALLYAGLLAAFVYRCYTFYKKRSTASGR